jgi:hypothetical protein
MIPPADSRTGYLPVGIHSAPWAELQQRFAYNAHRVRLMDGLLLALGVLVPAGCREVLLDGSFVTAKTFPGDYDATWSVVGVDVGRLDPVFFDFSNKRIAMKTKYLGEFWPAQWPAAPGRVFSEYFQEDKNGVPKGIIEVDLRSLP